MARRQSLVQLSDELIALLDERAAKSGQSRSALIRSAVERYLASDVDGAIDVALVAAYRSVPQDEDPWIDLAARAAIRAEPW